MNQPPTTPSSNQQLIEAAKFAADVLAELYAKYQRKIGPFASQAQEANVRLGAALRGVETSADQKAANPPGCVCRFAHPSDPMCTYVPMWSCPRCKVGNGAALLSCQSCATPRSACACTWYDTGGVHAEGCRRAVKTEAAPTPNYRELNDCRSPEWCGPCEVERSSRAKPGGGG